MRWLAITVCLLSLACASQGRLVASRPHASAQRSITDIDQDGIRDQYDSCPTEAEDRDGFQDDDGCPDPDNDQDGVIDATADRCPSVPGPADLAGCPPSAEQAAGVNAQPTTQDAPALTLVGVVTRVEVSPIPRSSLDWLVSMTVDRTVRGEFAEAEFSFRIHSPSRAGIVVGARLQVDAYRTSTGNYTVSQTQFMRGSE